MALKMIKDLDISQKVIITVGEASAISGIGVNKIERMLLEPDCDFLLKNGGRKMVKKDKFIEYLMSQTEV